MNKLVFPGDELRARREEMGLSVEDVYRKLHIPLDCIRGLEEGDPERLSELCYVVGFLRTYCGHLEMEPEPYVDCLKEVTRPTTRFLGMARGDAPEEKPRWLAELVAWAAVCTILVLGWITYAVVLQPSGDASDGQVRADTVDMHVPDSPDSPESP